MKAVSITLLQPNPKTGDFRGNRDSLAELCRRVSCKADLVVVPLGSLEGGTGGGALERKDAEIVLKEAAASLPSLLCAERVLLSYSSGDSPVTILCEEGRTTEVTDGIVSFSGWIFGLTSDVEADVFIDAASHSRADRRRKIPENCPTLSAGIAGGQDRFIFAGDTGFRDGDSSFYLPNWSSGALSLTIEKSNDGLITRENARTDEEFPAVCADWRYEALRAALRDYVRKSGVKGVVIGLSGGIDSALSASLARDAVGAERVRVIRLPSRYTSDLSNHGAQDLARRQGMRLDTLSIEEAFGAFEHTLQGVFEGCGTDVTEENIQARIRGTLLMAVANKFNLLLLCNGNKAEAAMGYSTLYGDQTGGIAPLADLWKSDVKALCRARNAFEADPDVIPVEIIEREPSAELRDGQKDSDSLPPYDVIEKVLTAFLRGEDPYASNVADKETVKRIIRMTLRSNFKRAQSVPGLLLSDTPLSALEEWGFNTGYDF